MKLWTTKPTQIRITVHWNEEIRTQSRSLKQFDAECKTSSHKPETRIPARVKFPNAPPNFNEKKHSKHGIVGAPYKRSQNH